MNTWQSQICHWAGQHIPCNQSELHACNLVFVNSVGPKTLCLRCWTHGPTGPGQGWAALGAATPPATGGRHTWCLFAVEHS